MPEGVRTNFLIQSDFLSKIFNNSKDHYPAELFTASVQKKYISAFLINFQTFPVTIHVFIYLFNSPSAYRYQTFLFSFPFYLYITFIKMQVGDFKIHQF